MIPEKQKTTQKAINIFMQKIWSIFKEICKQDECYKCNADQNKTDKKCIQDSFIYIKLKTDKILVL